MSRIGQGEAAKNLLSSARLGAGAPVSAATRASFRRGSERGQVLRALQGDPRKPVTLRQFSWQRGES